MTNPDTDSAVSRLRDAPSATTHALPAANSADASFVEHIRQRGRDLTCHPLANGTIAITEEAGALLVQAADALAAAQRERDEARSMATHASDCLEAAQAHITALEAECVLHDQNSVKLLARVADLEAAQAQAVEIALDPRVSSDAQALIDRGEG